MCKQARGQGSVWNGGLLVYKGTERRWASRKEQGEIGVGFTEVDAGAFQVVRMLHVGGTA